MWERFTERAKHVVSRAREEAMRLGSEYVRTEHILLGLGREPECVATRALENLGVDIQSLVMEIEKQGQRGDAIVSGEEIAFTPRAKKVLELAVEESRQRYDSNIATQHILLGLVKEGGGIAAKILQDMKVDDERVRAEVIQLIGEVDKPPSEGASIPQAATKRSRQLFQTARYEAEKRGDKYLGAEHILYAICADSNSAATQVLAGLGANLAALIEISREPQERLETRTPRRKGRYAEDVHQILELSIEEAITDRRGYLGTEHVLLALTRSTETKIAQTLSNEGINYECVKAEIVRQISDDSLPGDA